MQDYAGITTQIEDLTQDLVDISLRYRPISRERNDFRAVLEHVEHAHQRIGYRNGASASAWNDWISDRQDWLQHWLPITEQSMTPEQLAEITEVSACWPSPRRPTNQRNSEIKESTHRQQFRPRTAWQQLPLPGLRPRTPNRGRPDAPALRGARDPSQCRLILQQPGIRPQ